MTARALKGKISDVRRIARLHGVSRVRVFGSHAAGRARRSSDLVDFKLDLQDLLACDVDVVTENGLSPYFKKAVLRTVKPLE